MCIKKTKSRKIYHNVVDLIGGERYAMIADNLPVSHPESTLIVLHVSEK
jgi:hypothetical protein